MSEDTYICLWCRRESSFPGARFGAIGWAHSSECYERFMMAYWRVQEPEHYGNPSRDERTHVQKALK